MNQLPNVVIVEDDGDWLQQYAKRLRSKDEYTIITAQTIEEAIEALENHQIAVVATDLKLLGSDTGGFDILTEVRKRNSTTQVIIFTGVGGKDDAYEAMKRGALDYLTKPLDYRRTKEAIIAAIGVHEEAKTLPRNRLPFPQKFVGDSQVIKTIYGEINNVIDSIEPTLLWGRSGSGKALVAETIHLASKRKRFVLVNCASYSEKTLERVLFGFQKGAFPEATQDEEGAFEQAAGGTLVLDSVDSLSLRFQNLLLTALHEGRAQRIGSKQSVKLSYDLDFRVIATSRIDLRLYVAENLFSEKLYDYFAKSVIKLPPLRLRKDDQTDDVLLLTGYFLNKYAPAAGPKPELSNEASAILQAYDFPGNVRELEEAIRMAIARAKSGVIAPDHLPEPMQDMIICPHGYSLKEQADEIAQELNSRPLVYLSGETRGWYQTTLADTFNKFGITATTSSKASTSNGGCSICQPLLSSRIAIFDITTPSPRVMYELGLAHSVGITCAVLKKEGSPIPIDLGQMVVLEYRDGAGLQQVVSTWLEEINAASKNTS